MNSLTLTTLLVSAFALLVSPASAIPIEVRDVFVPPILTPDAATVWTVGSLQNVTWSTADAPTQITNGKGMVVLARDGLMFTDEAGGLNDPLASGFDILLGQIEIQVPDVEPGSDYQIVLFGDSGNSSPEFTISA